MGTSITTQLQIQTADGWEDTYDAFFSHYDEETCSPFSEQNYGLFAFLADVRNYACIPVLSQPRGFPPAKTRTYNEGLGSLWEFNRRTDWPEHEGNSCATWFLVSELLAYDYDTVFENRRNSDSRDEPVPVGCGDLTTVREYIGPKFFEDLEVMRQLGDPEKTRVIISFAS